MDSLDFFRRNLKPIMAALTLMAMITFVFDDSMRAGNTTLVPIILAMLFGGGAFVWGTRRNKQNEYATMGAVIGLVIGLVVITFGARTSDDQPSIAGLTARDIHNLKQRRETANKIVSEMYFASHPMPKDLADRGPFMAQFFQMQLAQRVEQIQFGFGRELEQDVVFTNLLEREAERLGITVNDDAVTDFLKMICDQRLSTETFQNVTKKLHIGEHSLYDVLRAEIAARLAASVTVPHSSTTPDQRWRDFRKVNVRHTIEATTIPVEPFKKEIADPTDDKLLAFFQQHAEKVPGLKGEPGFRQPPRARLAYLEADFETLEKKVTPPTDDEVAKYYEDNKNFYIDRTPVKEEKPESEENADKKDESKKESPEKKDTDKKDTEKKDSNTPKSEEKPEAPKKDGDPKSDKKTDEKPAEKPKAEADPKSESPKSNDSGAGCDDKETTQKAAEEKSDKPAPKEDEKKPDSAKKPPADEEKKPEDKSDKPTDEKKDEKKPEDKKSEDDKPKTESDKPAEPSSEDKEKTEKKPEVRYKPFEDVKDDIREQLLRTRTLEEMVKQVDLAIAEMRQQGSYVIDDKEDPSYRSPQQIADALKQFAKTHDLKYVETEILSAEELQASDYSIASATDPLDQNFNRQGPVTVAQRVFARGNDTLHSPEIAEDLGTKNRFAYWVTERKGAHVPKFEDSGIREQVLKAWRTTEARPKAESRAKELAKLAVSEKKALKEVLAGQTTTGGKEALPLSVVEPPEFSHFTQQGSSAPNVNSLSPDSQPVELGQIVGLEKVDDEVLSAIDSLAIGATEVIPNADRSAYFVVQVKSRTDVSAEDDAPQRKEFLEKWPFSVPASQLASNASVPLRREWYEAIERKYGVVWPVK